MRGKSRQRLSLSFSLPHKRTQDMCAKALPHTRTPTLTHSRTTHAHALRTCVPKHSHTHTHSRTTHALPHSRTYVRKCASKQNLVTASPGNRSSDLPLECSSDLKCMRQSMLRVAAGLEVRLPACLDHTQGEKMLARTVSDQNNPWNTPLGHSRQEKNTVDRKKNTVDRKNIAKTTVDRKKT